MKSETFITKEDLEESLEKLVESITTYQETRTIEVGSWTEYKKTGHYIPYNSFQDLEIEDEIFHPGHTEEVKETKEKVEDTEFVENFIQRIRDSPKTLNQLLVYKSKIPPKTSSQLANITFRIEYSNYFRSLDKETITDHIGWELNNNKITDKQKLNIALELLEKDYFNSEIPKKISEQFFEIIRRTFNQEIMKDHRLRSIVRSSDPDRYYLASISDILHRPDKYDVKQIINSEKGHSFAKSLIS